MRCNRTRLLAVLAIIVIIAIILIEPKLIPALALISAVAALFVAMKENPPQPAAKEGMHGSRLIEGGFDSDLPSSRPKSFCPNASGAQIEAAVLEVLAGDDSTSSGDRQNNGSPVKVNEGFYTIPGDRPPYPVAVPEVVVPEAAVPDFQWKSTDGLSGAETAYKGAVDVSEYNYESASQPSYTSSEFGMQGGDDSFPAGAYDMTADDAWVQGHSDRARSEIEIDDEFNAVETGNGNDGNPFDLARTNAPKAAPPCIDDEANDDTYDIDERNTYQARSRNDPTRVAAGTMQRVRDMGKYFREEVEEREDDYWWGRHEW